MTLLKGSKETPWLSTGVFLFICTFIIIALPLTLPLALCLPSIYCIFSDKITKLNPIVIGLLPVVLILIPIFTQSIILYICLLVSGIILLWAIRRGSFGFAIFIPTGMLFLLFVIYISIIAKADVYMVYRIIFNWVNSSLDQVYASYKQILSANDMMEIDIIRPTIQTWIIRMFPAIIITSYSFIMWINMLMVSKNKNLILNLWRCPDWIVVFFIIAGVLTLLPDNRMQIIGLNLLAIVSYVYFFQGLAIISYYLNKGNVNKIVKWPIYILILSQIYIMIIVSLLGLFDTWFYFRDKA